MKRVGYAVAILLLIFLTTFIGLYYIYNTKNELVDLTASILEYVEEGELDKAKDTAEQLSIRWKKKEGSLVFFVENRELDELTFNVSRLESYIHEDYLVELRAECEKIITVLEHVWDSERPSLHNIF